LNLKDVEVAAGLKISVYFRVKCLLEDEYYANLECKVVDAHMMTK
jgi:hypothetical protein